MSVIRKFLDLSTAHLDDASRHLLDEAARDTFVSINKSDLPNGMTVDGERGGPAAQALIVYVTAYGWYCYAHDDIGVLEESGVPKVLIDIFIRARKHGCDYVMFDADAGEDECLPTFESSDAA